MIPLQGQYPPIPTPFHGERVATARLAENIARWNEEPLEGYTVLGSNGEAPLLEDDERREVIRSARRAIPEGKRLMIVGAGRESTRATVRTVREAFELGADAVLVGVPSYYKPMLEDAVLESHLRAVADASPGPILLYSVPQFTGVPLSPALVSALASHPRIVGIKDSGGELENLRALVRVGRERGGPFSVLTGSATVLADGILGGASGAILAVANVAPRLCAAVIAAAARGDPLEARSALERLLPLSQAVTRVHGIGGLKAALDRVGYYGGDPRPPLPAASRAARAEIAALLTQLGLVT